MNIRRLAPPRTGRRHRADYILLLCVGVLLLAGLIVIYSISPVLSHKIIGDADRNYFLYGQLRHMAFGLVAFAVASNVHWQRWKSFLPVLIVLSGLALLVLMIPGFGISSRGATRWIGFGDVSFQPAELLKLTLVVLMATRLAAFSREQLRNPKSTLWPTAAVLGIVAVFVLFLQKDLGTMLVIAALVIGVFFASGVDLKQLAVLLGLGGGVGVLSIMLFPHRLERIATFLNPGEDMAGSSYHLNQALIAIGSGGLFGVGLGKSVQVYGYLPEAANDSIFAIFAETFGLLGATAILAIFGVLIWRCIRIAAAAPDKQSQLLVVGITSWIGMQMFVNIGAMIGLIPLTGIPLPFLSYGGTSLLFIMVAMGIVVNISKYTQKETTHADNLKRRRHRRAHHAFARGGGRPQLSR